VPFTTEIDVALGMVIMRFSATVTVGDFVRGREQLSAQPGWDPRFAHIFDLTGVGKIDLPTEALRGMATAAPMFDKTALQILVAVPGTLPFGLARMFQSLGAAERPNVRIVNTLPEAFEIVAAPNAALRR
jgi:hypothetical protein